MFRNSYIAELVHDISFAVFRVSALIEHSFLRKEFEGAAVDLSSYIDEEAIHRLERLVSLGQSIGEISQVNADVLIRELGNLRELLSVEENEESIEADISNLFQKDSQELPFKREKVNGNKTRISIAPSKRQTEILNFIRKLPSGCRMAELASSFQEVSKRTLRNDIASLIENGHIERVGSRGPYSYLRAIGNVGSETSSSADLEKKEDSVILLSEPAPRVFDDF